MGTLAGLVCLAGISYHQVRDGGPDPRDTAIMSGTILSEQSDARARGASEADAACETTAATGQNDAGRRADANCGGGGAQRDGDS